MGKVSLIAILAMVSIIIFSSDGSTADMHGGHSGHKMPMKNAANPGTSCHLAVHVTEEAERQPGGALYEGPPAQHHGKHAETMPHMQGAHMDHRSRHGGGFFMAPDKIHHLEGVYSGECGFRLFFFNAFTKPIRADRFRALIKIIPDDDQEPEVMRFLSPSPDGSILQAGIGESVSRPFDIELYVKFPESDEPQLFNIKVAAPATAAKPDPDAIELTIRERKVQGMKVIRVTQGDTVKLHWTADEATRLHLHGYDVETSVKPGSASPMTFRAHATGRFPITAHGDHSHGGQHGETTLIYLEEHPR